MISKISRLLISVLITFSLLTLNLAPEISAASPAPTPAAKATSAPNVATKKFQKAKVTPSAKQKAVTQKTTLIARAIKSIASLPKKIAGLIGIKKPPKKTVVKKHKPKIQRKKVTKPKKAAVKKQ